MAWVTASKGEFWVVKTESLTVATTTAKTGTSFTVPPGQDFLVGMYFASAASNTADLDVQGSYDNSTFASLKGDVIASKGTTAGLYIANYDISSNGEAPYYRLRIDPDASIGDSTLAVVGIVCFHRRALGQAYQ